MDTGLKTSGGEGGIRTLGTGVSPYNGLANRRILPLCHLSGVCGITVYHVRGMQLSRFASFRARVPRRIASGHQGDVCHSGGAENSPVAFDFLRRPKGLGIIVGKFHSRPTLDGRDFADQADGIEAHTPDWIAAAEIIRK